MSSVFLTASWRFLAMASFEVDPALLERYVPSGTTLDAFNGRTFVSVVGFRFLSTRVLGVPIPFHRDFDEINLRFYVRRDHPDGVRRGVVFIREIVPRAAIAWVANTVYHENYVALPMRHAVDESGVRYEFLSEGRWGGIEMEMEGEPATARDDSEEAFITEHYWGYAAQPDGGTLEYQVEHPQWRVWRARSCELSADWVGVYGAALGGILSAQPSSAFVADGSSVVVRKGRRLDS